MIPEKINYHLNSLITTSKMKYLTNWFTPFDSPVDIDRIPNYLNESTESSPQEINSIGIGRQLASNWVVILFVLITLLFSCGEKAGEKSLNEGIWRGVFQVKDGEIPFNFSVERDAKGTPLVSLLNSEDVFRLDDVYWVGDSLVIPVEIFNSYLIGKPEGDDFNGFLKRKEGSGSGTPFIASNHQDFRFEFSSNQSTTATVDGKWALRIIRSNGEPNETLGVFQQKDNEVTGSILTTTGDYRFLQGVVDGDSLKLSSFNGSSPMLFKARIDSGQDLSGVLVNAGGVTKVTGKKDDSATLADPYSITFLKEGYDKLEFTFPDLRGNPVSLTDPKYQDKVVVVNLMGSWCPNCLDEATYLAPWYKENWHRGVEIIALSFERQDDLEYAKERLEKFIKRLDVDYDILFAGKSDKNSAAEKLPALNTVFSFPTTIIIDKTGKVRKIHTGFYGPATGVYFDEFVTDFNQTIDELLVEDS
jgi:peroxiredoxin